MVVCSNDDLDLFYKVKFGNLGFFVGKSKLDYSETITACDLKLIDLMTRCEY